MEVYELQSKRVKLKSSSLEDLNDDLVAEILCRLPYKEVVRCKCVCKKWFSLIYNTHFVARFSSMNKLPWTFIYSAYRVIEKEDLVKSTSNDSNFKSPGFSLRFLPFYCNLQQRDPRICILKTHNDLVLCSQVKDDLSNTYYVCNPLTMQWVSLPPPSQPQRWACVDFICELTKDHRKEHHQYTFKVVRIPGQFRSTNVKVQIFSSEIGQWNEISNSVSVPNNVDSVHFEQVIIYKEKLILLGSMTASRGSDLTMINIIIDDISNGGHVFKIAHDFIPLCGGIYGLHRVPQGGLLSARVMFDFELCPSIMIWEFKEDNYEWTLMHEVCLKDAISENEWVSKNYLKRTFVMDERIEMDEKFASMPSILGFDPHDVNILYLNLYCEGRTGKYDIRKRSLNIVDHTQLSRFCDGNVHPLILQLWPTPVLPHQLPLC